MASYVFPIPAADNICIVRGDDYPGATLTLSTSPGTGDYFANLANKGKCVAFDVVKNSPTEVVISMPESRTKDLEPAAYEWSLLFRTTASPTDRTICVGQLTVIEYPTSKLTR